MKAAVVQWSNGFVVLLIGLAVAGCGGGGGGTEDGEGDEAPPSPPSGMLSAEPESCVIPADAAHCETTLSWSSSNADTVCLFNDAGEELACGESGSHDVSDIVSGVNTFHLKDDDSFDGQTLASVQVTGIDAPTVSVAFDPPTIIQGEHSTLTWNSEHTDSCSGIPESDSTATNGSKTYVREEFADWTVSITCEGPGGTATGSATLRVERPPVWSLTDDERRAYLAYYAPVIFKRSNENDRDERGLDLITNFDFDQDGVFSNNKRNWEEVYRFVEGHADVEHWRIRPTLYTALIEFMEPDETKSLLLLYHIYHAKQLGSIHDWERIELRIDDVQGTPGRGSERLRFVVITKHSEHKARNDPHADLNFMETANGRHPIIWQAEWSGSVFDPNRAELRFVQDAWRVLNERVDGEDDAEIDVTDSDGEKDVNYVFVCECSPGAREYWEAEAIGFDNAEALTAGVRKRVDWDEVPRVTYELQDLADILPTHTAAGGYEKHWKAPAHTILLESPLRGEGGAVELAAGWHDFYYFAKDDEDPLENREGYPDKTWFWGAYDWDGNRALKVRAYQGDALAFQGGSRGEASGRLDSHGSYWWQHDFFAHAGRQGSEEFQYGRWLASDWYTETQGGFDGRWVSLFED